MTPRARKLPEDKKGWLARAIDGIDAKTVTTLAIAVIAAFGYQDNRQRTDRVDTKAQAAANVSRATRGRLTALVDSLVFEVARQDSAIDALRAAVARLRVARARPVATPEPVGFIGPEEPEDEAGDEVEDPGLPPAPKRRGLFGRLWDALKPGD